MGVNTQQKRIIDIILCLLETGKFPGDEAYGMVTVLHDKAGITYGKHQSTDRADSLDKIVLRYLDRHGQYAIALQPYLDQLYRDETVPLDPKNLPPWAIQLKQLLHEAGSDPIMQQVQDEIFDEEYWEPSYRAGIAMGMKLPLTFAVIYDSWVQGAFSTVRRRFPEVPPARGGDEKRWTVAYLRARRAWFEGRSNPLLRNAVYRPDAFLALVNEGNWNLTTPFMVRGREVS
jgi:chitosanase